MADQLTKRQIEKLGAKCDRLECLVSRAASADMGRFAFSVGSMPLEKWTALLDRWHAAKLKYSGAITARNRAARIRAQNRKRTPQSRDKFALEAAMVAAETHLDLIAECRPDFATARELTDANAAFTLADALYDIAQEKFQNAERVAAITGIRPRRQSSARLVTDGCVRTGKYKMIDGARVPVLELIE